MEHLLHYVWKYRLYDEQNLCTTDGKSIEIIDPGIENRDSGPDFFNAKVSIEGTIWAGSVELHEKASDWIRHGHSTDLSYDNVILHVIEINDKTILRSNQTVIPQLIISIPQKIIDNMEWLLSAEATLACKEKLPIIESVYKTHWMDALLSERLHRKTDDIFRWLEHYEHDWEQVFYILLSRNFGFGTNNDAFERLARSLPLKIIKKQRGSASQIEALFLGQAGLLDSPCDNKPHYYKFLQQEYKFLRHKYGLRPIDSHVFKNLRIRPNATPHIKLVELAAIWAKQDFLFSKIMEARTVKCLKEHFRISPSTFWDTHYKFSHESPESKKQLGENALNILLINAVAPIMFAFGKAHKKEEYNERAIRLLERIPPEQNHIVSAFRQSGISIKHAGDSQALIQLKREYCEKKRCLFCRFGFRLLKHS